MPQTKNNPDSLTVGLAQVAPAPRYLLHLCPGLAISLPTFYSLLSRSPLPAGAAPDVGR